MANIIEMPKLSDTMTVGTLLKWLKKEGDAVQTGDMLAEVETDKATMELESFFDGTLLKIFAGDGSQIAVGEPLCAIGKPDEKVEAPAPKAAPPAPAGDARKEPAQDQAKRDKDTAGAATTSKNEVQAKPAATPAEAASPPRLAGGEEAAASSTGEGRIKISPLARKLAVEKGIDAARVSGSGPGGRIVRADILAAEKSGTAKPGAAAPSPRSAAAANSGASLFARGPIQEEKTVQVSNMRGAIARRLVESKSQLPHFYVDIEIDAAPLLALREQLNAGLEAEGIKLSVNDLILKASADALRRVPQVNGSWQGDASNASGPATIQYFGAAHVAFAVALEDGLITPVIRDAHQKTIFQISSEARSLGKLAKDRKLKPEQFTGGTFCVSNLGMMGIPRFTAIINPPNAAILAVGTTVKKPVVKHDQIVIGETMTLTLSCDHRVVDGAVGAQFLNALKQLLESPAVLLV